MVVGHAMVVEVVVVQMMRRVAHVGRGRTTPGVVVVGRRLQGRWGWIVMRLTTHAM